MFGFIILQAGIIAGLIIRFVAANIFIAGFILSWIFLTVRDNKNQQNKTASITKYVIRFFKCIYVSVVLVLLFMIILVIWSPNIE
jgi:hypothetical protein